MREEEHEGKYDSYRCALGDRTLTHRLRSDRSVAPPVRKVPSRIATPGFPTLFFLCRTLAGFYPEVDLVLACRIETARPQAKTAVRYSIRRSAPSPEYACAPCLCCKAPRAVAPATGASGPPNARSLSVLLRSIPIAHGLKNPYRELLARHRVTGAGAKSRQRHNSQDSPHAWRAQCALAVQPSIRAGRTPNPR